MKKQMMKLTSVLAITCICLLGSGCARNVDYVKDRSAQVAKENNLAIVGYEGYQWGVYSGGNVWYMFRREPDNGIIYHGYFFKRPMADEIHLMSFSAIDAIKP